MKILISDKLSDEGVEFLEKQQGFQVVNRPGLPPEELLQEVADASALLVRSKTKVTPEVLAAAPLLKVVGRAGAGVDNIDLKEATRRGVVVMNTPGGNSTSVAEHTLALMLALARNIPTADSSMRAGQWKKSELMGQELHGKTLGVVGLGKIGVLVARLARSFGMKVTAYDPFISEQFAADQGIELRELNELLQVSDFVSLHLPVNDDTRGMVNVETLGLMKPTAFLVNAARGPLINEEDLLQALKTGGLAGAALDVFNNEPNPDPRLMATGKVVATPHIAGSTREAQIKVGYGIAQQVTDYLLHDIIRNAVNFPSVSSAEMEKLRPYLDLAERLGAIVGRICGIRFSEIGVRYYGELAKLNTKPVTSRIVNAVLRPSLSEDVNDINARDRAAERGIEVIETVSSRSRSYSNLISIQLRNVEETEWIEGAILHQGNLHLVSIDGIDIEAPLGDHLLFIRNDDKPGVVGQVGTILGNAGINIASFMLGRGARQAHAIGVLNVDDSLSREVLDQIRQVPAVRFAQAIEF
ncbi:MAG TPA: phosphoglycerate dehydrogenase [Acidobacteriota bacterium]|nr:phosphoglycerate dehydrogenase [Acidobacteriota bacterium]